MLGVSIVKFNLLISSVTLLLKLFIFSLSLTNVEFLILVTSFSKLSIFVFFKFSILVSVKRATSFTILGVAALNVLSSFISVFNRTTPFLEIVASGMFSNKSQFINFSFPNSSVNIFEKFVSKVFLNFFNPYKDKNFSLSSSLSSSFISCTELIFKPELSINKLLSESFKIGEPLISFVIIEYGKNLVLFSMLGRNKTLSIILFFFTLLKILLKITIFSII